MASPSSAYTWVMPIFLPNRPILSAMSGCSQTVETECRTGGRTSYRPPKRRRNLYPPGGRASSRRKTEHPRGIGGRRHGQVLETQACAASHDLRGVGQKARLVAL